MSQTCTAPLPRLKSSEFKGKLVAIEGTDGVARSIQVKLLRSWLERHGYNVLVTRIKHLELTGVDTAPPQEWHTPRHITLCLVDAIDLAEQLEHVILPGLHAGSVVLADRYIYSLMALATVRGVDPVWIRDTYHFAPQPDAVFYLRSTAEDLIARQVPPAESEGWESTHPEEVLRFRKYQAALLAEFEWLAQEYGFEVVDTARGVRRVCRDLRARMARLLAGRPVQAHVLLRAPSLDSYTPDPLSLARRALLAPGQASRRPASLPFDPRKTQLLTRRPSR